MRFNTLAAIASLCVGLAFAAPCNNELTKPVDIVIENSIVYLPPNPNFAPFCVCNCGPPRQQQQYNAGVTKSACKTVSGNIIQRGGRDECDLPRGNTLAFKEQCYHIGETTLPLGSRVCTGTC
ncbi:putative effector protein [Ceratobasidium theobromae]|uniref:Putative effector protein n=1 Tax=Ceratobasidium theobromae TaxID=1582974 RepID=A0A5N5QJ84_9AGAM|nr:putative effector protein [Ceratobasidium theobromae]